MREFVSWVAYRQKRGSFNVGLRMDRAAARLDAMYANNHSEHGGYKIWDFTPFEDEPPISLSDAMTAWH